MRHKGFLGVSQGLPEKGSHLATLTVLEGEDELRAPQQDPLLLLTPSLELPVTEQASYQLAELRANFNHPSL